MVIDKWTRLSSNNNNSLIIPLLGHKSKETFIELKNSYERLKSLNHKYKKWKKTAFQRDQNLSEENESIDLKDYMEKINLVLISLDDLITDIYNCALDEEKIFDVNEKNNIFNGVSLECDNFIQNMKDTKRDKNINFNFEINSCYNKCKTSINNINKKLKNQNKIENISLVQEQNNPGSISINPNIDRGQINIFSSKREFNNSVTIEQNNIQFSVEQESLSNIIRLILFCFVIGFLLFIFYLSKPQTNK